MLHSHVACTNPNATCAVLVLQAHPCHLLTCVALYQTDNDGAVIRLSHPSRPGSSLSDQIVAGHFTTEPTGQLSATGGLERLQGPNPVL